MGYINLNGKIQQAGNAVIMADNRAFRYGYGLFETMLCIDGQIQLKQYHWERLFEGLKQIHLEVPALLTPALLETEVLKTIAKNQLQTLCRVRLQLFAGNGGFFDATSNKAGYIIECFTLEPHVLALNEAGLTLGIIDHLRKSNDSLANLKSCNALIYAVAAREAKTNKWNDALVCNTAGNIIESTIANVFWVKDNQLFTPPLSEGCVAGVMRRHIMGSISVEEQPLTATILHNADAVFLTNAIRHIKWVAAIDDHAFSLGFTASIHKKIFP